MKKSQVWSDLFGGLLLKKAQATNPNPGDNKLKAVPHDSAPQAPWVSAGTD